MFDAKLNTLAGGISTEHLRVRRYIINKLKVEVLPRLAGTTHHITPSSLCQLLRSAALRHCYAQPYM
jgi:hypothetical protein